MVGSHDREQVRSEQHLHTEQAAPEPYPLPLGVRSFLLGATALAGPAFAWAALRLPWRPDAPVALLLWSLAAANSFTLVALLGSARHARRALGLLVALSLAASPLLVVAIANTSVVMVRMYGALGWALTAALAAIGWLLLLATLPVALVGLHGLRRLEARGREARRRAE